MTLREIKDRLRAGEVRALFLRGTTDVAPQLHASDKARIIEALDLEEALPAFTELADEQVDVFPYLDLAVQKAIIDQLPAAQVSAILNALSSDDRTTLFSFFDEEELPQYLAFLNPENEITTHDLLEYPENSVAMLVDTDFATVREDMTVAEAIHHLRRHLKDNEAADAFFVVDLDGRLIDDIPVRRLVLNDPATKISEIMDGFYITLSITDTKEDAITRFKEYDRVVLPVVDGDHKMLGVVTVDDVLDVAEEKDTREMQQFGGM
jgi:magnesium transporter